MYFRSSRNPDVFLSELIHEGTHAKEALEIKNLLDLGKTDEEIMSIFGNNWSFEKRAFSMNMHGRSYWKEQRF